MDTKASETVSVMLVGEGIAVLRAYFCACALGVSATVNCNNSFAQLHEIFKRIFGELVWHDLMILH